MLHRIDFDDYSFLEQLRDWERIAVTEGRIDDAKVYRKIITYVETARTSQRPHVNMRV